MIAKGGRPVNQNTGRGQCNALSCPGVRPVVGTSRKLAGTQIQFEWEPTVFQWAPCLAEQSQLFAAKLPHAVPRDPPATPMTAVRTERLELKSIAEHHGLQLGDSKRDFNPCPKVFPLGPVV